MTSDFSKKIDIPQRVLIDITGKNDENLYALGSQLNIDIKLKGNSIILNSDDEDKIDLTRKIIEGFVNLIDNDVRVDINDFENIISRFSKNGKYKNEYFYYYQIVKTFMGKNIGCKTLGQLKYIKSMEKNRLVICDGPAGSGKTFLAVSYAVKLLKENQIEKIVLVRPAIEAGENLGFLPGTYLEKIDPYFKPLYDALFHILGSQKVDKYINHGIVEIAPLAYMRGRTLNNSFIILDEAQNTTAKQMKMFLTRIGNASHTVIAGDTTQVDLPKNMCSGLKLIKKILNSVSEISFVNLDFNDIVRDNLVQKIIQAYDRYYKKNGNDYE